MNLVIKKFNELTIAELYEILKVRAEVFVVEQNCVYQDLDDIDYNSLHVFLEEEGKVKAYLRAYIKDANTGTVQIGRVLTTVRGTGLGLDMLKTGIEAAKKELCTNKIYIEAQTYAIGFYEKVGFQVVSDEFLEDGIPHVAMELLV